MSETMIAEGRILTNEEAALEKMLQKARRKSVIDDLSKLEGEELLKALGPQIIEAVRKASTQPDVVGFLKEVMAGGYGASVEERLRAALFLAEHSKQQESK